MTTVRQLARLGRALSDATRLRLLHALAGGELCVCQLVELAELAASTVSRHLALLEQAGLVDRRKDGRWVHYRLARVTPLARAVVGALQAADELAGDRQRLKKLRALPREVLCKQQRRS